jgi:hypothetical protein
VVSSSLTHSPPGVDLWMHRAFWYSVVFCMRVAFRSWLIMMPVLFTACANLGPPEPPSLNLPKAPADLQASRKGSKVTLTWTIPTVTTDQQRIRNLGSTDICRGLQPELTECGTPVGQAPGETVPAGPKKEPSIGKKSAGPKISESYTDELPGSILAGNPEAYATYAVEALNLDKRGAGLSNQIHVPLVRTLPPPADLTASVTAQGIVLGWTNDAPAESLSALHYVYRVYRRQEGAAQPVVVGELSPGTDRTLTLTDSTIEWQKTYYYHVDAVTVIPQEHKRNQKGQQNIEVPGEDSPEVKVFANDIFPPPVPSGLQAVSSGPGQPPFIDLIWAPDSEADLAGYNVYRREENGPTVKLNSELVRTPAYRDTSAVPARTYSYSVSAVDVYGNESGRSEEASETVPQS